VTRPDELPRTTFPDERFTELPAAYYFAETDYRDLHLRSHVPLRPLYATLSKIRRLCIRHA